MDFDISSVLQFLHGSLVGTYVRESMWGYPALETVHMFGLGLLFGGIIVFDLRLLGVGRSVEVARAAALLLPWVLVGFLLNLASGLALFASDAVEFAANRAFQFKVLFLLLAGINTLIYMGRWRLAGADWDGHVVRSRSAKVQAVLSILLWVLVITAGRMIAYFE